MTDLITKLRERLALADPVPVAFERGPVVEADGFARERIEYRGLEGDTIPAFLFTPIGHDTLGGVVVFHQHNGEFHFGKSEVAEEDLDTSVYRDDQIDLNEVLREQFYLALPMKPLCREDCAGLCPQCGTNRNTGTCSCATEDVDPRLAPLRGLKQVADLRSAADRKSTRD